MNEHPSSLLCTHVEEDGRVCGHPPTCHLSERDMVPCTGPHYHIYERGPADSELTPDRPRGRTTWCQGGEHKRCIESGYGAGERPVCFCDCHPESRAKCPTCGHESFRHERDDNWPDPSTICMECPNGPEAVHAFEARPPVGEPRLDEQLEAARERVVERFYDDDSDETDLTDALLNLEAAVRRAADEEAEAEIRLLIKLALGRGQIREAAEARAEAAEQALRLFMDEDDSTWGDWLYHGAPQQMPERWAAARLVVHPDAAGNDWARAALSPAPALPLTEQPLPADHEED